MEETKILIVVSDIFANLIYTYNDSTIYGLYCIDKVRLYSTGLYKDLVSIHNTVYDEQCYIQRHIVKKY